MNSSMQIAPPPLTGGKLVLATIAVALAILLGNIVFGALMHVDFGLFVAGAFDASLSVTQLASDLGYASVPALSHAFRQVTGKTPTEFAGKE